MTGNEVQTKQEQHHDSASDRRQKSIVWISEIGLVAGCAVIFLAFLTALFGMYFPEGTTISGEPQDNRLDDLHRNGDVILGIDSQGAAAAQLFVGEIVRLERRVQRRGARSLTWTDASVGDEFSSNDAVQTFARSTVMLAVNKDSYLTIGENSLIVFDQQQADPMMTERQSVLLMMDGELSGTLSGKDRSRFLFGVELPNSDVTLLPDRPGDDVEFLITVNDDRSTTVNLHSGSARIVGRNGERRTIGAQESMTIDPSGTELRVSRLPPAPAGTGPADNTLVTYRNVPRDVIFNWAPVDRANRYHIVVSRDPDFTNRLVDDDVVGTSFTHGALNAGTYYWHVRSRIGWSQSGKSTRRRVRVVQDLEAPFLQLDPPPDGVSAGNWRLNGRTESGASVFVDGVRIMHEAGHIDQAIELQPGANIITVKAMDAVGNLSYASLSINAK